jgi:UTP--glucose-1-phosphate uridylyltransferase
MPLNTAVILAAGHGTRFLPATKAIPKEMLPIVDRPVIQYIVEEAVAAGFTKIVMVSALNKHVIEDYFDLDPELERLLETKGDDRRLAEVRRLREMAEIVSVRQKGRGGNGHAVLAARSVVGDEPFAVFFPDDVIVHEQPAIGQLAAVHERFGSTVIAVQEVPHEEVVNYGVIEPDTVETRLHRVRSIIEKPSLEQAPSNLTTVGRFIVTPRLFEVLDNTPTGRAGELWLMDAFDSLAREEDVYAYQYEGERFDCGQPLGLLKASLRIASRRPEMAPALLEYARSFSEVPR